jgi:hypothetical protein
MVLEVNRSEIRVVIVPMPATVESRVRVSIVNTIIGFIADESPLNVEYRRFRTGCRHDPIGVNLRSKELLDDAVRFVRQ